MKEEIMATTEDMNMIGKIEILETMIRMLNRIGIIIINRTIMKKRKRNSLNLSIREETSTKIHNMSSFKHRNMQTMIDIIKIGIRDPIVINPKDNMKKIIIR